MAIQYGATIENLNLAIVKAKTKTDGVYSFRGFSYKVVGGRLTHLAYGGEVLERAGNFNVVLGNYAGVGSSYEKKALQQLNNK